MGDKAYEKPRLRELGTLSGLTMGMNGSCPDGAGLNSTQLGGMSGCGVSGDASGMG
jgi:hypothetical protein